MPTFAHAEDTRVYRHGVWSREVGFSADQLIDAYERGRQEEREALLRDVKTHITEGIERALDESEALYLELKTVHELTPLRIHLRVLSAMPFQGEALFLVPPEQFVSDAMLEVYEAAEDRSEKFAERAGEDTDLVFRFMGFSEHIDDAAIRGDGFAFTYEQQQKGTA